ncbi:ribosome recycling factor [Coxiella endosymbiont of Amblyomma sculptum]|uniref:ribosome recycling factor n=1 Tax=Coxiella endosymbiont of Amblyomma sculptum TaxID=2487929 RepID=UPI00132E786B|nr:ribosome recycling factor [Coxiella endosymbiont of Amblyomma sculptum]QHG92335.1 ribosome recycling factor [Coxiella endosymbiont of Amblyomma sculptum]
MQRSVVVLKNGLMKLRDGYAHSGLLENVTVSCYGKNIPLYQLATIVVDSPCMLTVTPWEGENGIVTIVKAIQSAGLGLNPCVTGMAIRVPLPPLTEERRKELSRVVCDEAERARVAVRNIRREANNNLKKLLREKIINEDEKRCIQTDIQNLTNKKISEIDDVVSKKIADLMKV